MLVTFLNSILVIYCCQETARGKISLQKTMLFSYILFLSFQMLIFNFGGFTWLSIFLLSGGDGSAFRGWKITFLLKFVIFLILVLLLFPLLLVT